MTSLHFLLFTSTEKTGAEVPRKARTFWRAARGLGAWMVKDPTSVWEIENDKKRTFENVKRCLKIFVYSGEPHISKGQAWPSEDPSFVQVAAFVSLSKVLGSVVVLAGLKMSGSGMLWDVVGYPACVLAMAKVNPELKGTTKPGTPHSSIWQGGNGCDPRLRLLEGFKT